MKILWIVVYREGRKKWKAEELWRQVMLEKYRIYEEL